MGFGLVDRRRGSYRQTFRCPERRHGCLQMGPPLSLVRSEPEKDRRCRIGSARTHIGIVLFTSSSNCRALCPKGFPTRREAHGPSSRRGHERLGASDVLRTESDERDPLIPPSLASLTQRHPLVLHLERPLVFFDLEATGTDPQDARVIQIGMQRFVPANGGVTLTDTLHGLVDPQQDVPEQVTSLTGISTADVRQAPPFDDWADRIAALVEDADLAGYNAIAYDLPLLDAEFQRIGRSLPGPDDRVVLDPYRLEQVLHPRTLSGLYERYTDTELDDAHDALRDVEAAGVVLQQQLASHGMDGTPAELANFIRGEYLDDGRKLKKDGGSVVICFGKHEGKTLRTLQSDHPDYFEWMYETIDELRPHIDDAL